MSSFSCPQFDVNRDWCERIADLCVPGRPGCVLYQNSVFAVPWQDCLEEKRRQAETTLKDDLLGQNGQ